MSNLFTVPNILYIISSIEELLYMSESSRSPEISYTYNSINICFYLKNGRSEVTIGNGEHSSFYYIGDNKKVLKSFQFTNNTITDTNGSFHKAFKEIRAFDREYVSQIKNINTSIDRASFGLEEVN
jgi:hypothetical protein